jgi:hypothetical protein
VEQPEKRGRGRPRGTFVVAPDQDRWIADIHAAKKLADEAEAQLRELIDRAHAAGVTYRTIAPVVGLSVPGLTSRNVQAKKKQREAAERS